MCGKDIKIINLLKKKKKRIEEIDFKSKKFDEEQHYSSNPFAFSKEKTYVWIEKTNEKKCNG